MKITANMLKELGACYGQLDILKKTFPKGAILNDDNCFKAAQAGLDADWAASNFLNGAHRHVYEVGVADAQ